MRNIREKLAYILAEYKYNKGGMPSFMYIVLGVVVWGLGISMILLISYMVIIRRLI